MKSSATLSVIVWCAFVFLLAGSGNRAPAATLKAAQTSKSGSRILFDDFSYFDRREMTRPAQPDTTPDLRHRRHR